eukprot:6345194-Amphidinium_carterae.1
MLSDRCQTYRRSRLQIVGKVRVCSEGVVVAGSAQSTFASDQISGANGPEHDSRGYRWQPDASVALIDLDQWCQLHKQAPELY